MKKTIFGLLAAVVVLLVFTSESYGIPSFARKYKTSCATCHVAMPKLTAFGEAFRRNGYQFPEGGDVEATKEEPVSLGAEGNKKAFPDALWPSTIPGSVPVSIIAELEATYAPKETPKWDFRSLEGEVEVVTAGTLGEDISVFGELEVVDDAIEIERANIIFSNLFGGSTATFNLKLGKFEPGVFSFSNARRISPEYGITTGKLGDNEWSLESAQKGLELNGVVGDGRLGYNLGLVEGRKNLVNSQKDVYAHLNYKIGGMRLDGVVAGGFQTSLGATHPWQDNSVAIGGFLYKGTATLAEGVEDGFTTVGADVNAWVDRLNFIAAFAKQSDDSPFIDHPGKASDLTSFMVEGSYIIYPWFVPLVRFESSKVKDAKNSDTKLISAIQFLVRPNVRCALEFNFANEPPETNLTFKEFAVGVTFGL